jgi:SAM-dependent methyltransferase
MKKSPYLFEDATGRFSRRVANYVLYRPGYPPELAAHLARHARLHSGSCIADIGSGTGLLSRTFLEAGFTITGVEPNREMREAGNRELAGYPRFRSVEGTADSTTLPDASCDLVMAGQAFHWFDPAPTRVEWVRILKPGGVAALIWNERDTSSPFMSEAEDVINKYATALDAEGIIREGGRGRIAAFFAPAPFTLDDFPNAQTFGLEGLVGRIASCSYTPGEGDPGYNHMAADLRRVFERHQRDGQVSFAYRTKVFWGRLT